MSENANIDDRIRQIEERAKTLGWDYLDDSHLLPGIKVKVVSFRIGPVAAITKGEHKNYVHFKHVHQFSKDEEGFEAAELLLSLYEAKAAGRKVRIPHPNEDGLCGEECCLMSSSDAFQDCNIDAAVQNRPGPNCPGEGDYLLVKDGE